MTEKKPEFSEGGTPILRHEHREREWTVPQHHGEHLEEIEKHLEKHVGKVATVFHEIVSDLIHLDVLFVTASKDRPYHLLVTSGVSDEPMHVPEGAEQYRRAELMIALPETWPLEGDEAKEEKNYWPVRWLKFVGRLPHEYNTWIGWGHSIPNGDPAEPIADTKFVGVTLAPPYWLTEDFFQLQTKSGERISFYSMIPLYAEEMDLKLKKGADELDRRFAKAGIGYVLDTNRPNVALKRGWFKG